MNSTKKITLTTIKAFVRKSGKGLHIRCDRSFDGMTDCVQATWRKEFSLAMLADSDNQHHTLGIRGAWFVLHSRDYAQRC